MALLSLSYVAREPEPEQTMNVCMYYECVCVYEFVI